MLFHDLLGNLGVDLAVQDLGLVAKHHLEDGFLLAQTDAAGLCDGHPADMLGFDKGQDALHRVAGSGGDPDRGADPRDPGAPRWDRPSNREPRARLAAHLGMEVLGLSTITNKAAGLGHATLDHAEVLEVGQRVRANLEKLVRAVV